VTTDIDTLATALYVTTDDLLKAFPEIAPPRPAASAQVQLSDAELITLAVMQVLEGYTSERRWLRHAHTHLRHLFPYLLGQSGYNKRLRAASYLVTYMIRVWRGTPRRGTTMCGWWTPPRWNAPAPGTR
jgi:hypothetical protein